MKFKSLTVLTPLCIWAVLSYAQENRQSPDTSINISARFVTINNKKMSNLTTEINNRTNAYIRKFISNEQKLKSSFWKLDSNATKTLFLSDPKTIYLGYLKAISSDSVRSNRIQGEYLPNADTLHCALLFLNQKAGSLSSSVSTAQLGGTLTSMEQLQGKINVDNALQQYIEQRTAQIKQFFQLQSAVPADLQKLYTKYNQQLYYYSAQLQTYKSMLNDPDKLAQAAVQVLEKMPAFVGFMKNNSYLSGLLPSSTSNGDETSAYGMQTRDAINDQLQKQVSTGGPGAASALSTGLQAAQSQLEGLKDKLSSLGEGASAADLPASFKPNDQKTKTFLQRLEFGVNMQTTQSNNYYQTITDFGASSGYKLGKENIIGVGASYRLGWGSSIQHIVLSSQGVGLRSFLQIRLKGSFSAAGGFEYNYATPFVNFQQLRQLQNWTKSGLLGVTKSVALKNRFVKKTTVSLLWDFLSYQQIPKTQPVLLRLGYAF